MRKYFLSIVALVGMLFATSCQESLVEPQVGGTTTFTVQVPDQMGTKAIGGHDLVNKLYVEVYAQGATGNVIFETTADKKQDGSFEVSMNLIQDQHYSIIFWAQKEGAYVVENLRRIPMNVNHPNNESGAAFFAYLNDFVPTGTSQTVTLKRPFAQLNLGTTKESLNTDAGNFVLSQSEISVKGVAESFNTVLGYGEGSKDVYFELKNVPAEVLKVADNEYKYISMNYLPVAGDNKALVEVKAKVTVKDAQNNTQDIYHVFTSVPVQENYRTNIVGNLISSTTDFIVEVNDDWAGADNNIVKTEVSNATELQAAIENTVGGEIVLTDDIVLTQTLEFGSASTKSGATAETEFILDLNGKTIDAPLAENSETNHIYALENYSKLTIKGNGTINARGIFNYGDLTLENGTINAIDGNGGYAIRNYSGSEFIMNGGTLATTLEDDHKVDEGGYDATTLRVDAGATATINGGIINNICDYTFALDNYGAVIINAGTFTSVHSTVSSYGNLTINGGSFTCDGKEGVTSHALVAWDRSETTITGGSFDGKDNYNGFNVDAGEGSLVSISGGKFLRVHSGSLYGKGTITVSGGIFFDDPSARLADGYASVKNEDGTWGVCEAKVIIGEKGYSSLQAAIDAVKEGETITLRDDITITEPAYGQNALNYTKGVNCIIDLNGNTLSANTGNSVFRFNTSQIESDNNVIVTLKNGTVISGEGTWCALMAAGKSENAKAIFNLEDLIVNGSKAGDLLVKAWDNSLINATNVTINAKNCAGGFYALGGEMVLDHCSVNQKGLHTAPYLSMAIAVSNGGKITVNSGNYITEPTSSSEGNNQGTTHGSWCAGVMNSGGSLIINGGTFINGNFDDDNLATAARGLIFGDTKSEIIINDGVFNALKTIVDYQNNLGVQPNPNIVINGGDFSADPSVVTSYGGVVFAEGKVPVEGENGRWTVEEVCDAVIGNQRYATLQEAFNNVSDGETIVLQRNITLSETADLAEGKTAVLDLNGKNITSGYQQGSETKHIYPINNSGILTIYDSKGDGFIEGRGIYNQDEAILTINKTTVKSIDFNGGACIWSYGTGKVYLNNATLIGNTGCVSSEGYVEINGGTYTCYSGIDDNGEQKTSPTYNIRAYNGLKITDGTFTSRHGVISIGGGKAILEGGSYTIRFAAATTSNVLYVYGDANVVVNDGYYLSDDANKKADSGAAIVVSGSEASLEAYGGYFLGMNGMVSGNAKLYGGTYNTVWDYNHYDNIKDRIAQGYKATQNEDGSWTVSKE